MFVKRKKKSEDVVIRMSYQEAEIINGVLRNVAGEFDGPRQTVATLTTLLTGAGIATGDKFVSRENRVPGVTFLKEPA